MASEESISSVYRGSLVYRRIKMEVWGDKKVDFWEVYSKDGNRAVPGSFNSLNEAIRVAERTYNIPETA